MISNSNYKSTIELYNQLHVKGTTQLSPRVGHYLIKSVISSKIPNHATPVDVATALWKHLKEDTFDEEMVVRIQLKTFENNPSSSTMNLKNLVGNIIEVRSIYLDRTVLPNAKVICHWSMYLAEQLDDNDYLEDNIEDIAVHQAAELEESILEIDNAVLDVEMYIEEWDNYEANLYLDIEEAQVKKEHEAAIKLNSQNNNNK